MRIGKLFDAVVQGGRPSLPDLVSINKLVDCPDFFVVFGSSDKHWDRLDEELPFAVFGFRGDYYAVLLDANLRCVTGVVPNAAAIDAQGVCRGWSFAPVDTCTVRFYDGYFGALKIPESRMNEWGLAGGVVLRRNELHQYLNRPRYIAEPCVSGSW